MKDAHVSRERGLAADRRWLHLDAFGRFFVCAFGDWRRLV